MTIGIGSVWSSEVPRITSKFKINLTKNIKLADKNSDFFFFCLTKPKNPFKLGMPLKKYYEKHFLAFVTGINISPQNQDYSPLPYFQKISFEKSLY